MSSASQVVLVGNKADLPAGDEKREATRAAAEVFATQNQLVHIEASARSGNNVEEIFQVGGGRPALGGKWPSGGGGSGVAS